MDSVEPFVSNTDKNIYAIRGLKEEVAAVVFAKVSRSPKSFRANMEEVIANDLVAGEKAAAFHQKWTLDFGHKSVAELASAKIGVERVSRIATAELEQSSPYLSFIEYSQRYQQPARGDWHNPIKPTNYHLHNAFEGTMHAIYDIFESLVADLITYHVGQGKKARDAKPLAWEDARYVLPLATLANLAVVGNGRAIRDGVVEMLSSRHREVREMAEAISEETQAELPTLVRYVKAQKVRAREMGLASTMLEQASSVEVSDTPVVVNLQDWTGEGTTEPERIALRRVLGGLMAEHGYSAMATEVEAVVAPYEYQKAIYESLLSSVGPHDDLPKSFKRVQYSFIIEASEVTYHQIMRHRSATTFNGRPTFQNGYVTPPTIQAAGLTAKYETAIAMARDLWEVFIKNGYEFEAEYLVSNACRRSFLFDTTLYGMITLQKLRQFNPHAQWEIRDVVAKMAEQISDEEVHPNLLLKEADHE